ncbi:MAG: glycosyltransferase [Acidobacteriota bacterium]
MKIGHSIHGLGLGGAQQVIKGIVGAASPDVEHVVYSCHGGISQPPIEAAGATVRLVPRRIPKFDPLWVRALRRAMREDDIDLVHGHLFGDSLHAYFAARGLGVPMMMTLHSAAEARSGWQRRGYTFLLQRADATVACAGFVHGSYRRAVGDAAADIQTIANGIDFPAPVELDEATRTTRRTSLGVRPGAVVIGAIGRIVGIKAYHLLIEAVHRTRERVHCDLQLVLIGDGDERTRLEKTVDELGANDGVVFAGRRSDVPDLLPVLDAVAFSSLFEGLPIALLEAMAAARPIVATAVGGIPEAIRHDREGLLVPSQDVIALANAIGRIASDASLRARLGDAARERFLADFHVDRMTERYEALYRELTGSPRDAAPRTNR